MQDDQWLLLAGSSFFAANLAMSLTVLRVATRLKVLSRANNDYSFDSEFNSDPWCCRGLEREGAVWVRGSILCQLAMIHSGSFSRSMYTSVRDTPNKPLHESSKKVHSRAE
ncbi:hypothetical protein BKA57DRAFT_488529 [Linnemannia elongata]|nr:hypothetical protein BKA57DRAFT_488529 [Linnemannia elongata]